MWLEAILSKDDFASLAEELLPLSVHLGEARSADHYVRFTGPADVSLVAGKGLRLTCKAELSWPVLGVDVPIHVDSLTALLEPEISNDLGADELSFKLEIESVDVVWAPALIDRGIVRAINDALKEKRSELTWQFAKTLSHLYALPKLLEPLRALSLEVLWGKARTTEEAVVFAVSFQMRAIRKDEPPLETKAPAPDDPTTEDRETSPDRSLELSARVLPGVVAAGVLLALVTGVVGLKGLYRWLASPELASGRRTR